MLFSEPDRHVALDFQPFWGCDLGGDDRDGDLALMILIQGRLWDGVIGSGGDDVVLLCVLGVPLWLAISTIVSNADRIAGGSVSVRI